MILTRDTKIVVVSAYACGYYSGSEAGGDAIITPELAEKNKEGISSMEIYVYDLDGKHSQCEADIECHTMTIEQYALNYELYNNIEVLYKIGDTCDLDNHTLDFLDKLNSIVKKLAREVISETTKNIIFDKDYNINNEIVPKGTVATFNVKDNPNALSDFNVELKEGHREL